MLTTEEEARRKSCPETAISEQCVGSACMAWRWGEWQEAKEYGKPRGAPTKGYCGKAGRP